MNKPTDYPAQVEQSKTTANDASADITYAELKERVETKQLITDEMIRAARAKLEAAHSNATDTKAEQSKFSLSNIRDRFRSE